MAVAVLLFFAIMPSDTAGQTPLAAAVPGDTGRDERDRWSAQVAAGLTLVNSGSTLSAAFGYSPASRLELLINVERVHLSFQSENVQGVSSVFRGGTMTFVSGEVRFALLPPGGRLSAFATTGGGGGVSHPNVNATFPDRVRNHLAVVYFGGGVRVPLPRGLSLVGDARVLVALEGVDALAIWPLRAGLAWSF